MFKDKEYSPQTYFSKNVKTRLKEYIKGHINCKIYSDTLTVSIYAVNDIVFRYTLEDMSPKIVTGLTSEQLVQVIVKQYRRYINNLYFM